MANAGIAIGRPVVIATLEIHYVITAQVVEPSLTDSVIMQEPKKLWSTVASQAHIAPSVWMTEYLHQELGGAWMWLNLIRITVSKVTGNDTPIYQDHYMMLHDYHRDTDSEITLETNVMMSDFDPKTRFFDLSRR